MQVSLHNTVKSYNLTAGKSLPEWLAERRKNKKSTSGTENRIELLHDLEFPHCTRTLFRCPNGTHLFAAGDYPYRLKCFDVNELSMKYSFNADMNILGGVCLSSDYRKFALRGEGRQITVHHTAAIVERLRVPHMQRCLAYDPFNAELLSSGVSSEVFRISLETGAFVESYKTRCGEVGVNGVEVFRQGPVSGLVLAAGADGCLEGWDSRAPTPASRLVVCGEGSLAGLEEAAELRHVACEENGGMLFSCGTENGEVLVYDVRLQKPLLVKDHMNGLPIVKTYFFHGRSASTGEASFILSADTRSLKIWNKRDGANFTTIEAPADITDFCLFKSQQNLVSPFACDDSGVVGICCDVPRVQVHFIPQLGVAPRWASFLEVMTEELEEKNTATVYDDYTFVSKEEIDALGLTADDLAGGKVRPVMHGAFIENSLYREVKAVVDPTAFAKYVHENARKRKDKLWGDRISRFKRTTAEEMEEAAVAEAGAGNDANVPAGVAALRSDPRFAKAFDPSTGKAAAGFNLDRSNPEYAKLLRTIEERRQKAAARRGKYEAEMFSIVPDLDGEDEVSKANGATADHAAEAQTERQEDPAMDARAHLKGVRTSGKLTRKRAVSHGKDAADQRNAPSASQGMGGEKKVTMFEVEKDQAGVFTRHDKQIHAARKKSRAEKLTLEERLKRQQ